MSLTVALVTTLIKTWWSRLIDLGSSMMIPRYLSRAGLRATVQAATAMLIAKRGIGPRGFPPRRREVTSEEIIMLETGLVVQSLVG
ncbi:hypothetical protein B0H34DRAFT_736683 [Crassisporium funariophilum]|nr:hypothetical protein B0H34DRAFT_736683 [Crassisporium funariophilum]